MNRYAAIPEELKRHKQWVCAHADSKCPMCAYEYANASSSDPLTWSAFETAESAVADGHYEHIGYVFADNGYVGIDIDTGYDEDGFVTETASEIIGTLKSYTERSRSGRGFHIIVAGDIPFKGRNNLNGVEIYKTGRYFIMTGKTVFCDRIGRNQPGIDRVIDRFFPVSAKTGADDKHGNTIYRPRWKLNGRKIPLRPEYPPIAAGTRNLSLTSLAGAMHNVGYGKLQIYNELVIANRAACEPPLPKGELKAIVNSVTRYER